MGNWASCFSVQFGSPEPARSVSRAGDSNHGGSSGRQREGSGGERQLRTRRYTLKELAEATNNFDNRLLLGRGSFGNVYRGTLNIGRPSERSLEDTEAAELTMEVAVKKLAPDSLQGYDEWLNEVHFLEKLRHPNLVLLLGYCLENGEALLVYELCPNGSLDQALSRSSEGVRVLSWQERVRLAVDAAEGLHYLHEEIVIHRDFKPSNIVLDRNMSAKLTDFGMAKDGPQGGATHISTRVMGTLGYLDPSYMQLGRLWPASDVFSFGVLLLELLTGRKSKEDRPDEPGLRRWAWPLINQKTPDIRQLIDPNLGQDYSEPAAEKMALLAKRCLDFDHWNRPDMQLVLKALKKIEKDTFVNTQ